MLAAIGKVETNHGRLQAPGVTSGANFAGAAGPMQIGIGGKAGNTFGAYAVDGDGDGISNVYNPADAIFTAASSCAATAAARAVTCHEPSSPTTTPTGMSPRCSPSRPHR